MMMPVMPGSQSRTHFQGSSGDGSGYSVSARVGPPAGRCWRVRDDLQCFNRRRLRGAAGRDRRISRRKVMAGDWRGVGVVSIDHGLRMRRWRGILFLLNRAPESGCFSPDKSPVCRDADCGNPVFRRSDDFAANAWQSASCPFGLPVMKSGKRVRRKTRFHP